MKLESSPNVWFGFKEKKKKSLALDFPHLIAAMCSYVMYVLNKLKSLWM